MVRKAGKICPAKRITRSTVQYLNKIDKKRKHSNKSGKLRAERGRSNDWKSMSRKKKTDKEIMHEIVLVRV